MTGWPPRWVYGCMAASFSAAFLLGWLLLAGVLIVPVLVSMTVAVVRDWRDASDLRSLRHHERSRR